MKNTARFSTRALTLAGAASLLFSTVAMADLALVAAQSSVSLVSYKVLADGKSSVGEQHSLSQLSGGVDGDGKAEISIALDSIETGIPIRNERMTQYLFDTANHPNAIVKANVPDAVLAGGVHHIDLDAELTLHGQTQPLTLPVTVVSTESQVSVTSSQPVMIDAAAFELDGGIAKLVELAKLAHIPASVPVSFTLTFDRTGG